MKTTLILCLCTMFLSSCYFPKETATLYVPNQPTHHLLHKKNDYRVVAGVKFFDLQHEPLASGEFQVAYSPIKHLGILANYSYLNNDLEGFEKRKLHFGEIGLDAYIPIRWGDRKLHIFEFIGGYGWGKATDFRGGTFREAGLTLPLEDRFYAKSKRQFVQFNYGFKYYGRGKARFSIGPSFRLIRLNIYDIQHFSNAATVQLENPEMDLFGAGVNVQSGWRNVQFQYFAFFEMPFNEADEVFYEKYVDGRRAILNFGFGLKAGF